MKGVRAVIFDFGGVVCHRPLPEWIALAAEACGLSVPDFERAFWAHRLEYDSGRLEAFEYWREVARTAGITLDDAQIPSLVRQEVRFWSRFDPRMMNWIGQLRAEGFRTAILSNLPRALGEELLTRPDFAPHFDHLTLSYRLKMVKPEAGIYQHAIEGVGVLAGEALFLDDHARNVEGGRSVGLHAELFTTWEDLIEQDIAGRYGLPPPELLQSR